MLFLGFRMEEKIYRPRNILMLILTGLNIGLGTMFAYNQYFGGIALSELDYFLSFGATLLSFIATIAAYHKLYQGKANIPMVVFFGLLVLLDIVAVMMYEGAENAYESFKPDMLDRVKAILPFCIVCLGLYCCHTIYPRIFRHDILSAWILRGFVILAIAAIAYSLIFQMSGYISFFSHKGRIPEDDMPSSWTANKNSFGRIVLYGMFAEMALNERKTHFWRHFIIIPLGLWGIIIFCKTTLGLGVVSLTIYYFYRWVKTHKEHMLRNALTAIGMVAVFGFILLCVFTDMSYYINEEVGEFCKNFRDYLMEQQSDGWNVRFDAFNYYFDIMKNDGAHLFIGYGDNIYKNHMVIVANRGDFSTISFDSGYLLVLLKHGIIGWVFLGIAVIYYFGTIIQGWVYKAKLSTVSFIMLLAFLAFGISEALQPLSFDNFSLPFFLLMFIPLKNEIWNMKHPIPYINSEVYGAPEFSPLGAMRKTLFYLFPVAAVACSLPMIVFQRHPGNTWFVFTLTVIGLYLLLPILVSGASNLSHQRKNGRYFLLTFFAIVWSIASIVFVFIEPNVCLGLIGLGLVLSVILLSVGTIPNVVKALLSYIPYLVMGAMIGVMAYFVSDPRFVYDLYDYILIIAMPFILWALYMVLFDGVAPLKETSNTLNLLGTRLDEALAYRAVKRANKISLKEKRKADYY